jgi:hypothetical protein
VVVTGQRTPSSASAPPARLPDDALRPVLDPSALVEVDAPAIPLDPSALVEVDDGPSLPGFEPTIIGDNAPTSPDPRSVVIANCPRCRAAQPRPNPRVCGGCGYRLGPRRRREESVRDEGTKRCGECGMANAAERTVCINCASRLPSD